MIRRLEVAALNALLGFSRAVRYYGQNRARRWLYRLIDRPIVRAVSAWRGRELNAGRLAIAPTSGMFDRRRQP